MFKPLFDFLTDLTQGVKNPERFEENDYRLAAAALLIHLIGVDGAVSPVERAKLHSVLKRQFDLDDSATAELIEEATERDREAVDLYGFTSLLNRSLDEPARRHVVEMMWEIIYADGQVSEIEDNIVWRAADLLHVSSRDRLELRQTIRDRAAGTGGA
jgi:uncharacterized tellurite resistance protein B-like protein